MSEIELRRAQALLDSAEINGRTLDDDEAAEIDRLIAAAERDVGRPSTRRSAPSILNASHVSTRYAGTQRSADTHGFESFGAFAATVCAACGDDSAGQIRATQRLNNAATTYGNEGSGADGGFLVPPEFRASIMQKVLGEVSLASYCDQVPIAGTSVSFPKDETAPWGTAGIQAYWDGEAATLTQKKHAFEGSMVRAHKLTALVPVTNELLEDAPALDGFLRSKGAERIDFKVTDAIINGSGAGQPLGILNSSHTVQVSKETSQAADTIHGLNLVKMYCRMPMAWRRSAVWLVHPDAEPALMSAGIQVSNAAQSSYTGGQLVYIPPGGVSGSPYATLFGRPVIPAQSCQALGDVGDLIFAGMSQYCLVMRNPGVRIDTSIHLYFDQDVSAFRFTFRVGGQPWWSAPLTDKNGSTTRSAFVTLEAR